jgi:hypothetical protein
MKTLMRTLMMAGLVVVSMLVRVPGSEAAPILIYQASLGAAPGVSTTATGQSTVSIDLATNLLTFDAAWTGLSAVPLTGGLHIHCCVPTAPGNLQLSLALTIPLVTTGSSSETVLIPDALTPGFRNMHGAASLDDFLAGLAAGTAYVDIQNAQFPGGELRGTLVPVPEPTTISLLITGLMGLAMRHRRRAGVRSAALN